MSSVSMRLPAPAGARRPETCAVDHGARTTRFESVVLQHLDAAYNLAWWLLRDEHDAADVVQEACAKAWRFIEDYRGGDAKAWLLSVVRTTAADRRRQRLRLRRNEEDAAGARPNSEPAAEPLAALLHGADRALVSEALAALPDAHREVLVLREIEGLSYVQIAAVTGAPTGTVMSRLSRAREALAVALRASLRKE